MSFQPVRVTDPTSKSHTVSLFKTQDVVLVVNYGRICDIKVPPLLRVKERITRDAAEFVTFEHIELEDNFNASSTVYLGEIVVKTEEKKIGDEVHPACTMRMCVFLKADLASKEDVITVVNPIDAAVKLDPHNILEVVVYDPHFGACDSWDIGYLCDKSQLDINFHLLGKRTLPLSTAYLEDYKDKSDIYFLQPRNSVFHHPTCREHHFWIRFDSRILKIVKSQQNDIYYVGDIRFSGRTSAENTTNDVEKTIRIYLNQKSKFDWRVEKMLRVPDLKDDDENSEVYLPVDNQPTVKKRTEFYHTPTRQYGHDSDWTDEWEGEHQSRVFHMGKSFREIHLEMLESDVDSFDNGCYCLPILVTESNKILRKEKKLPNGTYEMIEYKP